MTRAERRNAQIYASTKRKRERRAAAGLCVDCGDDPRVLGKLRCEQCLAYMRDQYHARKSGKQVAA